MKPELLKVYEAARRDCCAGSLIFAAAPGPRQA
jgi:hypothetical protein